MYSKYMRVNVMANNLSTVNLNINTTKLGTYFYLSRGIGKMFMIE